MMDPLLSIAISVHSNKGVYALLLGSGVSRAAGMPTGQEVMLNLIRKIAAVKGESSEPDPTSWYRAAFGTEPHYGTLLADTTKSPAERSTLLRGYFEPTEEERERAEKQPTEAHRAIADLVAGGYVRVIVTTNFDRLMGQALEALGIVPTVIASADAAEGALPLVHSPCVIVKPNGDYLDPRISNTPDELVKYPEPMRQLLDEIFDDYGLIVCGWSAEWDTALRSTIERAKSRRFTTFWTYRSEPKELSARLIDLRRAVKVPITDADTFFRKLADNVSSLESLDRSHPLSAKAAQATVKRYVVDDRFRIRLHDLVMDESNRVYDELTGEHALDVSTAAPFTGEELTHRLAQYEAMSEVVVAMLATGCYWGDETHERFWAQSLERLANLPRRLRNCHEALVDLRLYPALLALYASGIAAISAERYGTLAALLTRPTVAPQFGGEDGPLVLAVYSNGVMKRDVGRMMPGMAGHYLPLNEHLAEAPVLRESTREFLAQDRQFDDTFDRFEYLMSLVYWDLYSKGAHHPWAPVGYYACRNFFEFDPSHIKVAQDISAEVASLEDEWPPLKAGLFDGSAERFVMVKAEFDAYIPSWRG